MVALSQGQTLGAVLRTIRTRADPELAAVASPARWHPWQDNVCLMELRLSGNSSHPMLIGARRGTSCAWMSPRRSSTSSRRLPLPTVHLPRQISLEPIRSRTRTKAPRLGLKAIHCLRSVSRALRLTHSSGAAGKCRRFLADPPGPGSSERNARINWNSRAIHTTSRQTGRGGWSP